MSNQTVEIQLGDKIYELRFEFGEVANLEKHFGKQLGYILSSEEQLGFDTIRGLYYCGLKWGRYKGITMDWLEIVLGKEVKNKLADGKAYDVILQELFTAPMEALKAQGYFQNKDVEVVEEKN
ncbi:hypothetical protein BTR23_07465 [Alkalihalophilus pseudofirmus]|nr:hypothetical protein BTR23_07465 [Alkalihalophilus pseudofirmus]